MRIVISLAGLQDLPTQPYEVATIEGARFLLAGGVAGGLTETATIEGRGLASDP